MATPKVIPTLDDTPKEPRVKPKRCPACQKPNRPEAVKCGSCGFNLDGPPPRPGAMPMAKPAKTGGGLKWLLVLLPVLVVAAAGVAIAVFGWDRALSTAQQFYNPKSPAASPKAAAPPTARSARQKAITTLKAEASVCFTEFNDLMDKTKQPAADQHALLQSYQTSMRQMNTVTPITAGCASDATGGDAQKVDLCDAAAQLRTCLSTVIPMQRERLGITP